MLIAIISFISGEPCFIAFIAAAMSADEGAFAPVGSAPPFGAIRGNSGAAGQAPPKPARTGGDDVVKQVKRDEPKVGRNDPCPCGSGKKYKKCHGA